MQVFEQKEIAIRSQFLTDTYFHETRGSIVNQKSPIIRRSGRLQAPRTQIRGHAKLFFYQKLTCHSLKSSTTSSADTLKTCALLITLSVNE